MRTFFLAILSFVRAAAQTDPSGPFDVLAVELASVR
jgi:hypothetical protein